MEAKAVWKGKMSFTGTAGSGFSLPMGSRAEDGGDEDGFRPMELLLVGLAGCTAMDVISILAKKRQEVTDFRVEIQAERANEHPRVFTNIMIEYFVAGRSIDPAAVERAVELSETKYCSAQAILNKSAKIEHKITISESEIN